MAGPFFVREAAPPDADQIAATHAAAWRETYTGLVPEQVLAEMAAAGPARWAADLAEPQGRSTWIGVERESGGVVAVAVAEAMGPGHVRPLRLSVLYVLQRCHGRGLGRVLLERALGDAPAYLWVAEGNESAERFYRRNGFGLDGTRHVEERWGGLADLRMVR
ncbi:GNAT family N-acetyltransferase [Georgenia sunbinii]|uniref:GNAT family N-acetyltransferase n=1 Tax=Georgenia sunbinii TaxID=3117728 RepID=UPI002F268B0F